MLPKQNRLSTTHEFNKTRRLGKKVETSLFKLFYFETAAAKEDSKIGVVVTNKFSKNAPIRNRVKRVFREVIRLSLERIRKGYWIVVHPKKAAEEKGYEEINTEFIKILQKVPFAR